VAQYAAGADRAKTAGFDGVEIHNANGYLLDQFLRDGTNLRTDEYGGPVRNRARLTLEVVDAVTKVWGGDRVGIRFSPGGVFNDMHDSNPLATFGHVLHELNRFKLAYAHLIVSTEDDLRHGAAPVPLVGLRQEFQGPLIVANGFNRATATQALSVSAFLGSAIPAAFVPIAWEARRICVIARSSQATRATVDSRRQR
jgi:N-ethylmaleimide reductase